MNSVIFLLYATLFLLPLTMIVLGLLWRKSGPKKINHVYGYRTKRAMASQESWDFAHIYSGKIFLSTGLIQLILIILLCVYLGFYHPSADENLIENVTLVVIMIQTLIFIVVIPIVEIKLKKKFP